MRKVSNDVFGFFAHLFIICVFDSINYSLFMPFPLANERNTKKTQERTLDMASNYVDIKNESIYGFVHQLCGIIRRLLR